MTLAAVKWLLDHGANPNAPLGHWDADVTPLHLAASRVTRRSCACSSKPAPIRHPRQQTRQRRDRLGRVLPTA